MPSATNETWTVARLLDWTRVFLSERQIESARLCAEILLARAMNCERLQLFLRYQHVPDPDVLTRFREAVRRAAAGEPIAYITGEKEFFSLTFETAPDVLIPRPETEIIVERVIAAVRREGLSRDAEILDVCTGSGCVAIALARHLPDVRVRASDKSADALAIARRNAERHALAERVAFLESDLFAALPAETRFDALTCNPPYIPTQELATLSPTVRDHEPRLALDGGDDGLAIVRRVLREAPPFMAPSGWLLMEVMAGQSATVQTLAAENGWTEVTVHRDAGGHERVLQARRPAD